MTQNARAEMQLGFGRSRQVLTICVTLDEMRLRAAEWSRADDGHVAEAALPFASGQVLGVHLTAHQVTMLLAHR